MPEISRFFGTVIKMFHDDHNPPHFHAVYMVRQEPLLIFNGQVSLMENCHLAFWNL